MSSAVHPNSDAHWSVVSGMSLRMGYFGGGDDGALAFIVVVVIVRCFLS